MHIALYSDCDSRGGVLSYTLNLAGALRAAGMRVSLFSHRPHDAASRSIVEEMEASCSTMVLLPPESHSAADASALAREISDSGADVFIPNYRQMPHAAAALGSRHEAFRSIGVCHNDHSSSYELLARFEGCLSKLICASPITAEALRARLPKRAADIETVPHGVKMAAETCKPYLGGVLRLIYHGRLVEEQKRVSLLLEVARRLVDQGIPFHLTLIGDGSEAASYRSMADAAPLAGHVTVLSGQPWASLSSYLVRSHIAVLASDYEGFCFSLAEGMGAGLPAVAFRGTGVIEQFVVQEQTGLLIESDSVVDFAAAIIRLQRDPSLWQRLANNTRPFIAERFSWPRAAESYIQVFEAALRDPDPKRWPIGRPAWVSPGRRTLRSVVERIGKEVGLWH